MVMQLVQMVKELKKCEEAGAITACLMQIYVYIETLAYFGSSISCADKVGKKAYIDWVDTYLKADQAQSYQYRGEDVYAARCALLHRFASEADFHATYDNPIKFGYHDGNKHAYNPKLDKTFAILGVRAFVNDFVIGVQSFLQDIKKRIADEDEREVLQNRLNKILAGVPFPIEVSPAA